MDTRHKLLNEITVQVHQREEMSSIAGNRPQFQEKKNVVLFCMGYSPCSCWTLIRDHKHEEAREEP